jgi:hypothetical protein
MRLTVTCQTNFFKKYQINEQTDMVAVSKIVSVS